MEGEGGGVKPAFSYYGGKERIASWVVNHLPPHTVYAEPFAGGASVLFAKDYPPITDNGFYREAINDVDERVINFYRVAKARPGELIAMVEATPYSKRDHYQAIELLKDKTADDLNRAWAFYVNINTSFANKINGGWGRQVMGNHKPTGWKNGKIHLHKALKRIDRVYIDSVDALDFIDYWDSPHTCFYCDPPYPSTDQGHYAGYTQTDLQALVDKLDTCQASFVLSGYDNIAPHDGWRRVEKEARMSAANGRDRHDMDTTRTEVLWIVDRSANTRDDLKPHLWSPSTGFVNQRHSQLSFI